MRKKGDGKPCTNKYKYGNVVFLFQPLQTALFFSINDHDYVARRLFETWHRRAVENWRFVPLISGLADGHLQANILRKIFGALLCTSLRIAEPWLALTDT